MQESLSGETTSAGAKRALAKVHKMLQAKRNALAHRDFREALEECLKVEASASVKILGYRLASRCPSCSTFETWQLVLDAVVTELASSQNASVLLYAIPLLQQIPLPLVLSFLVAAEKEPMNKLRAVLTHEQLDVRTAAIATLSRVTLSVAVAILTADALCAFPFESHEARVCSQQDVWTIVTDTWKLVFQALFTLDAASTDASTNTSTNTAAAAVAGAAFAAMRMLFARGSAVSALNNNVSTTNNEPPPLAQSAVNDLVATVFKDAWPRILSLQATAKRLPIQYQVDAALWLSMLLVMMLDKTGAQCPGVALPYLVIDVESSAGEDGDDDDSVGGADRGQGTIGSAGARRTRIDQLAIDMLACWLRPLLARNTTLAQSTTLCRAIALLLAHPLLTYARLLHAPALALALLAQCGYHRRADVKLEMGELLVRVVAWLDAPTCCALFGRVVEALSLMERETDRQGLLQLLMDAICDRVMKRQDFLLLESLCALDLFQQPSSLTSSSYARRPQRVSGAQVFRCLAHALALADDAALDAKCVQVAQVIVLKAFAGLLLTKPSAGISSTNEQSSLLCYVALLTQHVQRALHTPSLLFRETLELFGCDIQRAWRHVASIDVRVQLLWVALALASRMPGVVSLEALVEQLCAVVHESLAATSTNNTLNEPLSSSANAAFDDGRLGGSAGVGVSSAAPCATQSVAAETLVALVDCVQTLRTLAPQFASLIERASEQILQYTQTHASPGDHALQELLACAPTAADAASQRLFALEVFHPAHLFAPRKHQRALRAAATSTSNVTALTAAALRAESDSDVGVVVTGSSDPLSLRVSFRQPVDGHDDVVAICVACCNTTNLALSDFAIHVRPLGAVKCTDSSNDLVLRLLQGGGSASGGLAPFGVFKAEKRFALQRFAHVTFAFQVVFTEVDTAAADDNGGASEVLTIRLAPSEPFVLPFTALFRAPRAQFTTGAFFQRVWQRAEATCQFPLVSTLAQRSSDSSNKTLSLCQQLATHCSARVGIVRDLLVDTPVHIQMAFVTETRWDESVVASVTLTASDAATPKHWTGVLELRSTGAVVHEFVKAPTAALAAFCGSEVLEIARVAHPSVAVAPPQHPLTASSPCELPAAAVGSSFAAAIDFPGADLTVGARASSNKWAASPFDGSGDPFSGGSSGDQLRPAAAATASGFDDPWL